MDPKQRSALQSIGDLLRRTGSEAGALGGFIDDFLTYPSTGRAVVPPTAGMPERPAGQTGQQADGQAAARQQADGRTAVAADGSAQAGRSPIPFEEAAARLLLNLAQRSRFTLLEAANQPLHPLPLKAGDEATALVKGTLPDGRTLVQLAGETLELRLPTPVVQGEILRLALVTQQPKPVFALLGNRCMNSRGWSAMPPAG